MPGWARGVGRLLWPGTTWTVPSKDVVFLTFDDGPFPDITPWVMDRLEQNGFEGTFFMVGAQAQRHPDLVDDVRRRGHSLGNHTMNHEKGWDVQTSAYVQSVEACDAVLTQDGCEPRLFRPPYGKFTPRQASVLSRQKEVIMWDVLAGDYLGTEHAQEVLAHLKRCTRPGSIVVMHDSPKAWPVLQKVLPEYLSWLAKQGWASQVIPDR